MALAAAVVSRAAWALAVVLATGALPARADPTCSAPLVDGNCPPGATVLIPAPEYDLLIAGGIEVRRIRDNCLSTNEELAAKNLAAAQRIAATEPETSVWPAFALGAGVGAAFVAVLVLLVHR